MTRISYSEPDETKEVSNLMMTKQGEVIFIEINLQDFKCHVKNIEGSMLKSFEFKSIDEAKKKARLSVIELGVIINDEVREKE